MLRITLAGANNREGVSIGAMDVQMFGLAKSKTTRKAQRWFSDRRIPFHFVDLRKRAIAPGELRRWVQRFGIDELLDKGARSYREQGLRYLSAGEDDWIERLIGDPTVLRLPLVRCGRVLAYGDDPERWQEAAKQAGG